MRDDLLDFLLSEGPQLSGQLAVGLEKWLGITPAAARKKIERRSKSVRELKLPFARRAKFLYAATQYGSDKFWARLAEALEEGNGAYARVIRALRARGGLLPLAHLASAAGISSGARQISFERVWQDLVDTGLFQTIEVPGLGECFAFARKDASLDELLPDIRARLIAETVLLQSVHEWAAKLGLGSFGSFKLRICQQGTAPTVSVFQWDLTAPSYVSALATWNSGRPNPGFMVLDVLLKEQVELNDLLPFIYKCKTLRQVRNVRTLQFFVAHRYTPKALDAIRREGIVPATTESLFGTDVARALMELSGTLTQAATQAIDPEKFSHLFDKLGKVEGAAGTLRGALFEFVVADVMRRTVGGANVNMNKIYRKDGKDVAEVDVRVHVPDQEIRFIECKGLLPGRLLPDSEIEAWLTKRIPSVRSQTLENSEFKNIKLTFELWLTGELSPEAQRRISTAQAAVDPERYTIKVLLARDIEESVKRFPDLRKVVKQHFLEHPMAAPIDVINPFSKRQISQVEAAFSDLARRDFGSTPTEADQSPA
ncbi:hypothetical protein [Paraburkholderia caballeronis]|uniref:Uncharacterized protein n=1 Tax=Paraburkholderia caballeronis TaxID=416943 RepID=A0A1H7SGE6_9BURK|nr:hypothetical protein [Paraburkholderia caballeronis]PXW22292.1 hypothetical protein C7403_11516 [Paraburkholderia caballeronis]PXW95951.1 hypothetical protein C7407_11516 [Paraburkholderia caballeronis]RAJ92317.1 hypothetical protein C7409_11516 [Paraburkholderia caballeronis]TDV27870.1 hypothetical protein C7405_11516 [Paraburkholderia caballeronis]SEB52835.1 hypothetical protein SAMN05445871_0457 [Paraburkholderia caballeronis]